MNTSRQETEMSFCLGCDMIGVKSKLLHQDNPQLNSAQCWLANNCRFLLLREAKCLLVSIKCYSRKRHTLLFQTTSDTVHGLHILRQRDTVSLAQIIYPVRFSDLRIDRKFWEKKSDWSNIWGCMASMNTCHCMALRHRQSFELIIDVFFDDSFNQCP